MNAADIEKLLDEIKTNSKSNNIPIIVMQCITLGILILKPIFMYWIQAKYKADPPHESIRKFKGKDPTTDDVYYNDAYHDVSDENAPKEYRKDIMV